MSIKQKDNGNYLVDVRDENRNRIQRTFKTKTDAKAFEGEVYRQKYEALLVKNKLRKIRYPMSRALEDFLVTKSELRGASVRKYSHFVALMELFATKLGLVYMDEFTPDHATLFYNEIVKERPAPTISDKERVAKPKPKTVNFFIQTARSFFAQEMMKDHIKRNPFRHIKNLKVEKPRPEYYTIEELKAFFSQEMSEAYRNAFLGLLMTGMRFGELANLTWDDVDFQHKFIFVRSKGNFRTKTHNSERSIPITNDLYKLLIHIHSNKISEIYPFCSPKGEQLRERRTLETCKKVAEMLELHQERFFINSDILTQRSL